METHASNFDDQTREAVNSALVVAYENTVWLRNHEKVITEWLENYESGANTIFINIFLIISAVFSLMRLY